MLGKAIRQTLFGQSKGYEEKYLATILCNIYCISYLAIYRIFNVKQLN